MSVAVFKCVVTSATGSMAAGRSFSDANLSLLENGGVGCIAVLCKKKNRIFCGKPNVITNKIINETVKNQEFENHNKMVFGHLWLILHIDYL